MKRDLYSIIRFTESFLSKVSALELYSNRVKTRCLRHQRESAALVVNRGQIKILAAALKGPTYGPCLNSLTGCRCSSAEGKVIIKLFRLYNRLKVIPKGNLIFYSSITPDTEQASLIIESGLFSSFVWKHPSFQDADNLYLFNIHGFTLLQVEKLRTVHRRIIHSQNFETIPVEVIKKWLDS